MRRRSELAGGAQYMHRNAHNRLPTTAPGKCMCDKHTHQPEADASRIATHTSTRISTHASNAEQTSTRDNIFTQRRTRIIPINDNTNNTSPTMAVSAITSANTYWERRNRTPILRPHATISQQCRAITNHATVAQRRARHAQRVLTKNRCPMGNHPLQPQMRNPTRQSHTR